jgi:hypothetical protein
MEDEKGNAERGTLPFNLVLKNTQGHNGNAIGQPGQSPSTAKFYFQGLRPEWRSSRAPGDREFCQQWLEPAGRQFLGEGIACAVFGITLRRG